jgi:hypothetical protein
MAIPKPRQLRQFRMAGQAECEQICSRAERKSFRHGDTEGLTSFREGRFPAQRRTIAQKLA